MRTSAAIRPASRESVDFSDRTADLLTAVHVAGRGRDDDAPLDEARELVDLLRVVAAVGHRDDDDVGGGVLDAEADRERRAATVGVSVGTSAARRRAYFSRYGRVVSSGESYTTRISHGSVIASNEPVEARDDRVALVVDGDDDRDAGRHTRSPLPSRFHTSTTGTSASRSAYCVVRRRDDEQIGLREHVVERPEVGVVAARTGRCTARDRP